MNINPGLQKYSTEALYLKSPTTRKPFFGKPGSSHVLTTNGKTLVEIEVIYLAQKGSLHFTQSVLDFKRILSSIGRVPFKMLSRNIRKKQATKRFTLSERHQVLSLRPFQFSLISIL